MDGWIDKWRGWIDGRLGGRDRGMDGWMGCGLIATFLIWISEDIR